MPTTYLTHTAHFDHVLKIPIPPALPAVVGARGSKTLPPRLILHQNYIFNRQWFWLNLQSAYFNSTGYYKGNSEDIIAAREYIDTREALAEARAEKGAWDLAAAVGTVVIGVAAIVVTGGAAAPLVIVAAEVPLHMESQME
jgi:hypothetical protein